MDGGDGELGVLHQAEEATHAVATLDKLEADLQLVKRGIHLGHNQVAALIDETQLVRVAGEADDIGVGVAGAEVGGTVDPAVAVEDTVVDILEVLGVGQCHGTAERREGGGAVDGGAVAAGADTHGPIKGGSEAGDAGGAGGVGSVDDGPCGVANLLVGHLIGHAGLGVPGYVGAVGADVADEQDGTSTVGDAAGGTGDQNLVDIVGSAAAGGRGRRGIDIGSVLIEIETTGSAGAGGSPGHRRGVGSGVVVYNNNKVAVGITDKRGGEVEGHPTGTAEGGGSHLGQCACRHIIACVGEDCLRGVGQIEHNGTAIDRTVGIEREGGDGIHIGQFLGKVNLLRVAVAIELVQGQVDVGGTAVGYRRTAAQGAGAAAVDGADDLVADGGDTVLVERVKTETADVVVGSGHGVRLPGSGGLVFPGDNVFGGRMASRGGIPLEAEGVVVDASHGEVLHGHAVGRGGERGGDGAAGLIGAVALYPYIVGGAAGQAGEEGVGRTVGDNQAVGGIDVVHGGPIDDHVGVVGGVFLAPVDGGHIVADARHVDIGRRCAGAVAPHADVVDVVVAVAIGSVIVAEGNVAAGAGVVAEVNLEVVLCRGAGIVDNLDGVETVEAVGISHYADNKCVAGAGVHRPEAHAQLVHVDIVGDDRQHGVAKTIETQGIGSAVMVISGGGVVDLRHIGCRGVAGVGHGIIPAGRRDARGRSGAGGIGVEVLKVGKSHRAAGGTHIDNTGHAAVVDIADGANSDGIRRVGVKLVEGVGRGADLYRVFVAELYQPRGLAAAGSPADGDAVGRDIGGGQVLNLRAGVVDNLDVVDCRGRLGAAATVVRPEEDQLVGSGAYDKRTCLVGPGVGLCQGVRTDSSVAQVNPAIGNSRRASGIRGGAERHG